MRSKRILLLFMISMAVGIYGCDYVPRTVYQIETKDGQTINIACPIVQAGWSEFFYIKEGSCVIYK